jgi:hypothetical protein
MGWEGIEECADAFPSGLDRSFGGFAQQELELCEDLFDRVEIRGVGRQEEELGAGGTDRFADGGAFVAAEVVHDDDVAGGECRHQELLDPGGEELTIDRSVEHARGIDPVMAKRGDEGERAPSAERRSGDQLAASPAPATERRHVRLGPSLVDEDQALGIKPSLILLPLLAPARDRRPQLLGGEQRFF